MSSSLPAIVGPDALYREMYRHFQALFSTCRGDVSKESLISHLPPQIYGNPQALGAAITGAVLAMLDHRRKSVDWANVSLFALPEAIAMLTAGTPELLEDFDEIILEQGERTGAGLTTSWPVGMRVLFWERNDYTKYSRWLRALGKAARIHQRLTPAPLDGPLLREVKQKALEELRPVVARVQKWFREQRVQPLKDEVVEIFRREVLDASLAWLGDDHNLKLWTEFVRARTRSVVTCSAEKMFDDFAGFVTSHDSDYTRKKFSRKR